MPRFDQIDSSLFAGLDPAARSDVERHMEPRQLGAGEVLCREGEEGGSLFVVTNGLLHAVAASGAVLGRQRPGDVVGEAALLTGEPRSATLVARLPSEVLELSRDAFLAAAGRHPPLLINLARIVSHRMVARTSGAGGGRRAEAVAIVVGRSGWPDAEAALAAATASSPAASSIFDLTRPDAPLTAGVLAALEFSRRQQQRVFVVLGSDHEDLHLLLDYCDRSVALMSAEEAHELAGTRQLPVERLAPVTTTGNVGRLGRHLAGTKLGLALGAGGAKAYAHIGAIRVLERAGYVVDYIAGSSMGGWVGAWLALGMSSDEIEQTMRSAFTEDAGRAVFRAGAAGDPSGTVVMEQLARQTTGGADFGELRTPLILLAADLEGRCPAPMMTGPVHEAMVAAMTVPGLYPAFRRGQQRLVDAVVLTPVPSDALIAAGADVTVAINLLGRATLE
nr:cyclic nucleotide-binding domain-containing protein [Geodermatophilaceae bacterium]